VEKRWKKQAGSPELVWEKSRSGDRDVEMMDLEGAKLPLDFEGRNSKIRQGSRELLARNDLGSWPERVWKLEKISWKPGTRLGKAYE